MFFLTLSSQVCAKNVTQTTDNNLFIRAGLFYANIDSYLDIDNNKLDYEDHLNLEKNTFSPTLEIIYLFNERHLINFNIYALRRDATQDYLSKPFLGPFDNSVEYQVGMETESLLNTDIYQMNYGYNFIYQDAWALGVSFGIHIINFKTSINANGALENNNSQQVTKANKVNRRKLTVPLPNLGFFAHYDFSETWKISAHAQYLHILTDYLEGGMIDAHLALNYKITNNFTIIGAINYDHITFDDDHRNRDYSLSYRYIGPLLMLEYGF